MEWLAQLALGLLSAAGASWITVQLSLGKFRREKHWEKRFDEYAAIVAALHDLNRYVSEQATRLREPSTAGAIPGPTLDGMMGPMRALHRSIDNGLLVASKMVTRLQQLSASLEGLASQATTDLQRLEQAVKLVRGAIADAATIAREDLGVR